MAAQLNHTIIWCRDQHESAHFLADILGLPEPARSGPFLVVALSNGVSLDYHEVEGNVSMQHYAFLVSEREFDQMFARIRGRGLEYWADPGRTKRGETYTHDGGRGVYFLDPDGHLLELLTPTITDARRAS